MSARLIAKLKSASFTCTRKGYDRTEVDRFLRGVALELKNAETLQLVGRARPGPADPGPEVEEAERGDEVSLAEQRAAEIIAEARERARAIGAEAEETQRRVQQAAARIREEAERDAYRVRSAAMASVQELVELGKHGAVGELERAFAELDAATAVPTSRPGGRFDREAWLERAASEAEARFDAAAHEAFEEELSELSVDAPDARSADV